MPVPDPKPPLQRLREVLDASPALRFARSAPGLWDQAWKRSRSLLDSEIQTLRDNGNTCGDWTQLRLSGSGNLDAVSQCHFAGQVILELDIETPTLIRSRFRDCKIGSAEIVDVGSLDRVWVEQGARIHRVSRISGGSTFGMGLAIHPGSESGSRSVYLLEGWLLQDCTEMANLSPSDQENWAEEIRKSLQGVDGHFTKIGINANVESVSFLEDCFVGENSTIRGASLLRQCILASNAESPIHIGDGAIVENCVLEPGSRVDSHGQARQSLLLEYSGVERAGQIADSVLGPNTHIAKGEVTASLLGPFIGFHHQALLIGALWPEGRGNIGYGAKVGSNHTGRKPDQEIKPGEGAFFGLGCSIKFPANFEAAPYSLFAAGVSLPPQRLAFPFSLILSPTVFPHGAEGLNEILPGWMWGENSYSLIRGCYKYQDRNQAMRHPAPNPALPKDSPLHGTFLAAGLFSAPIATFVAQALAALKKAGRKRKRVYLERDIPGLGRNFLTRKNLIAAIAAYGNFLQFIRMLDLLLGRIPSRKNPIPSRTRFAEIAALLRKLSAATESALARDSSRGADIFPDYLVFHSENPSGDVVCRRLRQDVETLLGPLRKVFDGR